MDTLVCAVVGVVFGVCAEIGDGGRAAAYSASTAANRDGAGGVIMALFFRDSCAGRSRSTAGLGQIKIGTASSESAEEAHRFQSAVLRLWRCEQRYAETRTTRA